MNIKRIIHYIMSFIITANCGLCFLPLTQAAKTQVKSLQSTIYRPNSANPVAVNPKIDPILLPEETFEVKAVAQADLFVSLYGWAIIPGTDGSRDPERTITDFNGEITPDNKVKLTWKPRTIFQKEKVMGEKFWEGQAGDKFPDPPAGGVYPFDFANPIGEYEKIPETCEKLKTNCIEIDQYTYPACEQGSVPHSMSCFMNKEAYPAYELGGSNPQKTFLVFDQIVNPGKAFSSNPDMLRLEDLPDIDINNVLIDPTKITERSEVGWAYFRGPFLPTNIKGQIKTDFQSTSKAGDTGVSPMIIVDENLHQPVAFEFNQEITFKVTLTNNTANDIHDLRLQYSFDPLCLELIDNKKPLHSNDCPEYDNGKLSCMHNLLSSGQSSDFSLKLLTLDQACYESEVTLSALSASNNIKNNGISSTNIYISKKGLGPKPLLNNDPPNYTEIDYYYFYPPDQITETDQGDTWWADNHIIAGEYLPNITKNSYSSVYAFTYYTYMKHQIDYPDGAWEVFESYFPIKDKIILIDGFEQYEIYAAAEQCDEATENCKQYIQNEGVTRENAQLVAIIRDPSAEQVEITIGGSGLIEGKKYYFAIFEVRESGSAQLPEEVTKAVTDQELGGQHAIWGHLISTADEVVVDLSSLVAGSILQQIFSPITLASSTAVELQPSVQKPEWEIFEQPGNYTDKPLKTDKNGEMRMGVDTDQTVAIATKRLNRFAGNHFLSGSYNQTDTVNTSDRTDTFYVASNRAFVASYNVNSTVGGGVYYSAAIDPFGVVYDAWTKNIIPQAGVELSGRRKILAQYEDYRSFQETDTDGLFSFFAGQGYYYLHVNKIGNRSDNFVFPSAISDCLDNPPYKDIYCTVEKIEIIDTIEHRDIPIDPTIAGNINNNNNQTYTVYLGIQNENFSSFKTESLPNGKFSFFVPPGNYEIIKIEDIEGKSVDFQAGAVQVISKNTNSLDVSLL